MSTPLRRLAPVGLVAVLLLPSQAYAAELHVGPDQPYATIGAALAAAQPGDVLQIAAGDYDEAVVIDVPVSLIGAGPGVTRILGGAGDELVTVQSGGEVTLAGLTLDALGQRRCVRVDGSELAVQEVTTTGCVTSGAGGAFLVEHGALHIEGSDLGPGASAGGEGGQIYALDAEVGVELSTLGAASAHQGGLIGGVDASISLTGVTLSDGSASTGGAVHLTGGLLQIADSTLGGHQATSGAGGAIRAQLAVVVLEGVTLETNSAGGAGGHLALQGAGLQVSGSHFRGGVAGGQGGALVADGAGSVSIAGSTFTDNASGGNGGAVVLQDVPAFDLGTSTWCGNSASGLGARGGAIYLEGAGGVQGRVHTSVFVHNTTTYRGGAIFQDSGDLLLRNLHVLANSQADGGMLHLDGDSNTRSSLIAWSDTRGIDTRNNPQPIRYNLFFANDDGHSKHNAGPTNVLDADPLLYRYLPTGSCEAQDLRPMLDSPLIDAGDPDDEDPDGSRADIGAFGGPNADPQLYLDGDGDGFIGLFDCDDGDETIYPGADEIPVDGIDQSCDGGDLCYEDLDGDGVGSSNLVVGIPDCDAPGVAWIDGDCDDTDPTVYPGAPEVCDGQDNNCDGQVDEGLPSILQYLDGDGDGFGVETDLAEHCAELPGYALLAGDCDDTDPTIYPGAPEIVGDGIDQSCNGVDRCWVDADGDTWGGTDQADGTSLDCDAEPGLSSVDGDCDDLNVLVHPGAPEVCNGIDDNCSGLIDDDDPALDLTTAPLWFADTDGDGFGDPGVSLAACEAPEGYVANDTDCDDTDPTVYPDAPEVCDGRDNSCDGVIDTGLDTTTWYRDADGDGFGDPHATLEACAAPPGYVDNALDCDDTDPTIHPEAEEIVGDGIDQNCDGVDHCYEDLDGDGYGSDVVIPGTDLDCSGPYESAVGGDCDDTDPTVYPGTPGCDPVDGEDGPEDTGADLQPAPTADAVPRAWFCAVAGGGAPLAWWPLLVALAWRRRR